MMFYKEVFLGFVENSNLKACFAGLLYRRGTMIRTEEIRRSGQFLFNFFIILFDTSRTFTVFVQVITSLDSPGTQAES